nr:hypothetical protein [bacterium]
MKRRNTSFFFNPLPWLVLVVIFHMPPPGHAASDMEWIRLTRPLTPRSNSSICAIPAAGTILLFGGDNGTESNCSDTWEWDGTRWNPIDTDHVPDAMWGHGTMVRDDTLDRVLLLGCRFADSMFQIWEWTGTDWTLIDEDAGLPAEWYLFDAVYDSVRQTVCVFGGYSGGECRELWEWHAGGWSRVSETSPWPADGLGIAMAYHSGLQKTMLVCEDQGRMEVWYWDGTLWEKQEFEPPRPPVRNWMEIAYDPDRDRVVMFGGRGISDGTLDDTWEWDGTRWHAMDPLNYPSARSGYAFAWDETARCNILFGGALQGGEPQGDTWTWDGSDWTGFPPDPYYPPAVSSHAMAYHPGDGVAVLYGGVTVSRGITETFEWDGSAWDGAILEPNPGILTAHTMAYMAALDGMVVYGGYLAGGPDGFNDTMWLYRERTWTPLVPQTVPGPRAGAVMAYDACRDRLVVFGGVSGVTYDPYYSVEFSDETWVFDGMTWMRMDPDHHPPVRYDAGMAYDSCRDAMVLFGGVDASSLRNDTWEYRGEDWIPTDPATGKPAARAGAGFCFDADRCRIVMHGGIANTEPGFDETWEWDGYAWTLIEPAGGRMAPFHYTGMVYDAADRCAVMFGGGRDGYTVETLGYRHGNPDICEEMGVTLELSRTTFHAGDLFTCTARVCNNSGDAVTGYPLAVLLDVYGDYFWAPSFSTEFDSYLDVYPVFPGGVTEIDVVPPFQWPAGSGAAQDIRFYAALLDPGMRMIMGHWDMVTFGW